MDTWSQEHDPDDLIMSHDSPAQYEANTTLSFHVQSQTILSESETPRITYCNILACNKRQPPCNMAFSSINNIITNHEPLHGVQAVVWG